MGNYLADSNRVFNLRGQRIYDAVNGLVGTFFVFIMVIYAGFRGHRVVTQLPATYRTTKPPMMIPIDELKELLPGTVPSASFEFPVVSICPDDPGASIQVTYCAKVLSATTVACDQAGIVPVNTVYEGNTLNCVSVNQYPGNILIAGTSDEAFKIQVNVTGTSPGNHDGVLVYLHDQSNATFPSQLNMTFDNFFTAATYTVAEVAIRKLIEIDLDESFEIDFESKVSYLSLGQPIVKGQPSPIVIEIKYPVLEATYEKAFLILDMYNWLGEVGGVASLLFFVHRTVVYIIPLVLLRFDRYTDVKSKKANNYESFNNY